MASQRNVGIYQEIFIVGFRLAQIFPFTGMHFKPTPTRSLRNLQKQGGKKESRETSSISLFLIGGEEESLAVSPCQGWINVN